HRCHVRDRYRRGAGDRAAGVHRDQPRGPPRVARPDAARLPARPGDRPESRRCPRSRRQEKLAVVRNHEWRRRLSPRVETLASAAANADLSVRTGGVEVLERPQQAGLALAAYLLLGHRPGGCPACRLPRLSPGARLLLGVLSAQDAGKWGKLKQALLLGARV